MQLTILQEDLSKALTIAVRFASTRSSLPILGNFLLRAEKSKLKIKATNLEMSVTLAIGAKIEKEGEITVPAKLLVDIVTNLNHGQITLTNEKEELKIVSGSFKAKLPTTPVNDFPTLPEGLDSKKSFSIPTKVLTGSLGKILFSTSIDETRPILTGVLFIFKGESLSLVASDGFRLSRKTVKLQKPLEEMQFVIPKPSVMEIVKAAANGDLEFEFKASDNQLLIKSNDMIISSRIIEGTFPDFEKIIPKTSGTLVTVDKNDFAKAVKLAAVFAKVEGNIIKLTVKENTLQLTSENEKSGAQVNEIEAKVEGGNLEISYNYKFIEDFLNVSVGDSILIKLIDSISASIFEDPEDKDFLHLIMPVRVQS